MRKTEEQEIDGVRFRFQSLPFGKSRGVFLQLAKIVGPVLKAIPMKPGDPFPIMEALTEALDRVSEPELESLTHALAQDCAYSIDGGKKWPMLSGKDGREAVFEGRLALYFKWLQASITFNFADFFDAFRVPAASAPEGDPKV
jgi:hypothetical protein